MATLEMTIEGELEDTSSPAPLASARRALEPPILEPWKQGDEPEIAARADWLFEILMI